MSSHREAPEISKDPVADSADLYAFVSPDNPDTVTIIANYIPLESPDGGPNFYEFGTDVVYAINIDNDGDGKADISYLFQFQSETTNLNTFLYNTGPISTLTDPNWNRRQTYTVTRVLEDGKMAVLGSGLPCPPCNIGPLSTPNYETALADAAVKQVGNGITVFAGQRAEGFYVDLGAIFDLGVLRPFAADHILGNLITTMAGVNATKALNVHSIAMQVPMNQLTRHHAMPTNPAAKDSVIGVWTSAYRQAATVLPSNPKPTSSPVNAGPWVQVSRLGNPLINEVIIPLSQKDFWNHEAPASDVQFAQYVSNPELARLLPVLYPGPAGGPAVFPNLAAYNAAGTPNRADLVAILMTGIPSGVIAGFQNFTGTVQADMLRLNMAIPPAVTSSTLPSNLGLLGGDLAGFPNGRRVFDDVVTIEVQAVAGATLGLVDPSFTPDAAASLVNQGLTSGGTDITAMGTENYLASFPYLGVPHSGYFTPAS
ncbi:MAG TPA: DUF4331 domain-containing protein [Acidimicrobiales bacterium]|nr:DUF4331 domain-containing protein [Acidimicrobiales bacterium]